MKSKSQPVSFPFIITLSAELTQFSNQVCTCNFDQTVQINFCKKKEKKDLLTLLILSSFENMGQKNALLGHVKHS